MLQATIQVVEVVPPAAGKKRGRVKDASGALYQAGFPLLSSFQPGGTYSITYKEDSFMGAGFRVIEGAQPAAGVAQPVQQQVNKMPMPQSVSAPMVTTAGTTRNYSNNHDMATAERIFVCGALNASIGNGGIDPMGLNVNSVVSMVNIYREAWKRTFGGHPTVGDDMNDAIPFDQAGSGGFR